MYEIRMKAYEGPEKYIFISYAHRDADKVWPILDKLDAAGYRIWFDDGVVPGSEWPEYIAEHLSGAAAVLAFVSGNSVESANCRREITYALSKNKPFVYVMLEQTALSRGLELQLAAQYCVQRDNYRTEDKFLAKLIGAEVLAPCMQPPEEPAEPAPEAAAPEAPVTAAPAAEPAKPVRAKREKKEKPPREKKPRRKLSGRTKLLLLALAAILVIGAGAVFLLARPASGPRARYAAASEVPAIDGRLVGYWVETDVQYGGDARLSSSFWSTYNIFFLHDGTFSIDSSSSDTRFKTVAADRKGEFFVVSAADGRSDLLQKLRDWELGVKGANTAELEKYRNLQTVYGFPDGDLNTLVLHITGEYQRDALTVQAIDATYTYTRKPVSDVWMTAYLYGDWTDDAGGSWRFWFRRSGSGIEQVFTYTDASGAVSKSKYSPSVYAENGGVRYEHGVIRFLFEDFFSPYYAVEDIRADSVTLRSDSGTLTLTRAFAS